MRRRKGVQDFVAWEGPSRIDGSPVAVIVTGLERLSQNDKTGVMTQVWILRQDIHPKEAVLTGADHGICGECPLRGTGDGTLRSCYVRVEISPSTVWRKYARGGYVRPTLQEWQKWMVGRDVRLGAYGEPTAAPLHIIASLVKDSRMWTGYTHRWREVNRDWAAILMASVETDGQARESQRAGWRPFLALPDDEDVPNGTFLCPAERDNNPLQCIDCGACAGTKHGTRNPHAVYPFVPMHGQGRKNYRRMHPLPVVSL